MINMPNTYTQIYIQAIFSPYNRDCMIEPNWEEELYKYITTIIQNNGHKLIAINGTYDHIHILIGLKPHQSLSNLIQKIKTSTTNWINRTNLIKTHFSWQEGFGAFSYGHSQLNDIAQYIMNQKQHHRKSSFKEEYLTFLKKFNIEFKKQYLFDFWSNEKSDL